MMQYTIPEDEYVIFRFEKRMLVSSGVKYVLKKTKQNIILICLNQDTAIYT